jgi:hypothetical protein
MRQLRGGRGVGGGRITAMPAPMLGAARAKLRIATDELGMTIRLPTHFEPLAKDLLHTVGL